MIDHRRENRGRAAAERSLPRPLKRARRCAGHRRPVVASDASIDAEFQIFWIVGRTPRWANRACRIAGGRRWRTGCKG